MESTSETQVDTSSTEVVSNSETVTNTVDEQPESSSETPVDESYRQALPNVQPTTITIDDLMASLEAITKKESDDRLLITNLFNKSIIEIRPKLLTWASLGFPYNYIFFSIDINPPIQCSDGVARSLFNYIEFLTTKNISTHLREFEQKIPGMVLSYSEYFSKIDIHISKA
jgi:hypothetical protein